MLPCDYHLVTFTIPSELRQFVRSHQRLCYGALFAAAAHALRTALGNPKFCGADTLGFTVVLHTFGRDLNYHPHIHVVIPGGGLRIGEWCPTRPGFLAPVKVLSKLFRAEFERLLRTRLDADTLPPASEFRREFVCDVQAVGNGVSTLKYLSRYVFRTAITNNRIVGLHHGSSSTSFDPQPQATAFSDPPATRQAARTPASLRSVPACGQTATVTFTYRRGGESRDRRMTLPVLEFLRRFLQHVLPRGLHKVRHYGFLSRRSRIDLEDVRAAIVEARSVADADVELQQLPIPWQRPVLSRPAAEASGSACPHCGGRLVFEQFHRIRPPPQFARS